MPRKRVLWLLYPTYLLIMLISMIAVAWYASRSLHQFYIDQTAHSLQVRASLVAERVGSMLEDSSSLTTTIASLAAKTDARITIILPSGRVIADSDLSPDSVDNQSTELELMGARTGPFGVAARYSKSLGQNIMYVAVPLRQATTLKGYVRVSQPVGFIADSLRNIRIKIALGAVLIGLLSAAVALFMARRISRPIQQLRRGAERFASGDFSARVPSDDSDEIGGLAEAMNEMAVQLDDRIRTITVQRNEQNAILSSMVEGVIAVDTDQRLIIINKAASRLIHANPDQARGRTIHEIVRNTDLLQLISRALSSPLPVQGEIVLTERGDQFLQAQGTILKDQAGKSIGALLVFHDITTLRRLENMRRDFVANVSHELKTPITSIKGFVETLNDGAIDSPQDARRFLGILARQVDRLNSIIEDLLALSRIEQEAEKHEIPLDTGNLIEVLHSAVQFCASKAAEKGVDIQLSCDPGLRANINAPLLEQAVTNLIDNAIKYSGVTAPILVSAAPVDGEIVISVLDSGCGISSEHLPRLWERFYRVDKARSRTLGGTGLGLAIVKHITIAHGGRVSVNSTVGKGSTFRIHLPANSPV